MSARANPLSLLHHCKVCPQSCCYDSFFITLPGERDRIVAAGYEDHFEKIVLSDDALEDLTETERKLVPHDRYFYVLAYEGRYCPYFLAGYGCSIEGFKSIVCQAFPAAYHFGKNGLKLMANPACSAHKKIGQDFLNAAEPLIHIYHAALPDRLYRCVKDQFYEQTRLKNDGG